MKFLDISLPLHEGMVVWPGDASFERKERRGTGIVSGLKLSTHTGTHIDAPKHFLFDKAGVDRIAPSKLIGKCRVIEVRPLPFSLPRPGEGREGSKPGNLIKVADIAKFKIKPHDRFLFKTRNSKLLKQKKFTADYVSLSLAAAKFLAAKKIDLVGIDYFGVEAKGAPGHPVHKALLGAGIVIVEGLDLSKVKSGKYNLAVLPLKLIGADGSPARAVLWQ